MIVERIEFVRSFPVRKMLLDYAATIAPTTPPLGLYAIQQTPWLRMPEPRPHYRKPRPLYIVPRAVTVAVPNIYGTTQAQAVYLITSIGLTVGAVNYANSPDVAAGLVLSQFPDAGMQVMLGTAVAYTISLGPVQTGPGSGNYSIDLEVTEITRGQLSLQWSATPAQTGIVWYVEVNGVSQGNTGANTWTLANLAVDTTYDVQVVGQVGVTLPVQSNKVVYQYGSTEVMYVYPTINSTPAGT
jgi:hypothetical protein